MVYQWIAMDRGLRLAVLIGVALCCCLRHCDGASLMPAQFDCTPATYCAPQCLDNTTQTQMAGSEFSLMGSSTGEQQLHSAVVHMVAAVSTRFGNVTNNVANGLHLSFQYLCCTNQSERRLIGQALASVKWKAIPVRFSRVVCAASMALALADPQAQGALFGVVSAFEEAIAARGIPIEQFRSEQAPFHASLFNAHPPRAVNMQEVINVAQSTIPTGGSLNSVPIMVDSFTFDGNVYPATPGSDLTTNS
jgi:hypothetical protein